MNPRLRQLLADGESRGQATEKDEITSEKATIETLEKTLEKTSVKTSVEMSVEMSEKTSSKGLAGRLVEGGW